MTMRGQMSEAPRPALAMPVQGRFARAAVLAFSAVLLLYVVLGSIWVVSIPLWEAPDEPAHFLYALALAEEGSLPAPPPPQTASFWLNGFVTSGYEWHQAPLYYGLAAGIIRLNRTLDLAPPFAGFPTVNPDFPHTIRLFALPATGFSEVHLVRLLGVLLGAGVVWSAAAMAKLAFPHAQLLPPLAAGLVAFIPQFTFLHAYVTNDSLANLAGALGLLAWIHLLVAPPHRLRRAWLWAGLAGSLALAVKMTAWFLLPLALVALVDSHRRKQRTATQLAADVGIWLLCLTVVPLLVSLIWPEFIPRLWSAPHTGGIRPEFLSVAHFQTLVPTTHASFWGRFGWVNVAVPALVPWMLNLVWLAGALGAVWVWRRAAQTSAHLPATLLLCLAAWGIVFLLFIGFNLTVVQPQGRFFYPAIAAPILIVAWGWHAALARRPQWTLVGVIFLLAILVLVNITALSSGLRVAYSL